MGKWKPGDVGLVTYSGGETDVALRLDPDGWAVPGGTVVDNGTQPIRPLVVLDPEDQEQVKQLRHAVLRSMHELDQGYYDPALETVLGHALKILASPPPKPEEPTGLGAVVEDVDGVPWVRCENADREPHWYARNKMRHYADIAAVKVLSEGVTS